MAKTLAGTLLALGIVILSGITSTAQEVAPFQDKGQPGKGQPGKGQPGGPTKAGLLVNDAAKTFKGYTLISPSRSNNSYLIDMEGRIVQTWKSNANPGAVVYFLENGNLLRTAKVKGAPLDPGDGSGGRVSEYTWSGEMIWDYKVATATQVQHHDTIKLPNGNYLIDVWEKQSKESAIAAGRKPETASAILSCGLLEVQPTGKATGKIVWEWHAWDHLVQDVDDKKANYGKVADHPELIDLNFGPGGGRGGMGGGQVDWLHINGVSYNPELDQIMMSVHEFSELWIIDHSTKPTEVGGHTGGKQGKGGDLLYRWGNPRAYRAGTAADQQLFAQHNTHWIEKGLPGEGHAIVFNNGGRRPGGNFSSVDELVLPVDKKGAYELKAGKAFGPAKPLWSYSAPKKTDFYATNISGAERLPNGNTLICSGTNSTVFEVDSKNEIVWKFVVPAVGGGGGGPGGSNLFRAQRYAPDFAGLAGKDLKPGKTLVEELQGRATGQ